MEAKDSIMNRDWYRCNQRYSSPANDQNGEHRDDGVLGQSAYSSLYSPCNSRINLQLRYLTLFNSRSWQSIRSAFSVKLLHTLVQSAHNLSRHSSTTSDQQLLALTSWLSVTDSTFLTLRLFLLCVVSFRLQEQAQSSRLYHYSIKSTRDANKAEH